MTSIRRAGGWPTVAARELLDLWWGGKMPLLVVIFAVAMSALSFLLATNAELRLIPPLEMIDLLFKMSIVVAVFTAVTIGSGGIAGEREARTLESLLLTPVSRRAIVFGKFIAALSPWPVLLAVIAPYAAVLAPSFDEFLFALQWAAILGSLLVIFAAGLGLLVSIRSNSNRASLALSLAVIVLTLIPTQLPGTAQTGDVGLLFKKINPMESAAHLLEKLIVNNRTIEEMWAFLVSPTVAAVAVAAILFATPYLRLELDGQGSLFARRAASAGAALLLAAALLAAPAVMAQESPEAARLRIAIDAEYKIVQAGDTVDFETVVSNASGEAVASVAVAMNIINLEDGAPVDPEDWSDERTQSVEGLLPGGETTLDWEVKAILEGDYAIYVVALPVPEDEAETTWPVATRAVHLTVEAHTDLNPGGILPLTVGMPAGLVLAWLGFAAIRRRGID